MWIVLQLLSYSLLNWVLFVGIAFSLSFFGGWIGIFAGHFLVAFAVWLLDIDYALTHEYMDTDIVFTMGVFLRVLLINTVLLPVSFLGLWLRKIRKVKAEAGERADSTSPTPAEE